MTEAGRGTEYAPHAIRHVYDRLCELRPATAWALGGILGDESHVYGYHRARAVLPPDDYSVTLPRDQDGPWWAAAALDITPPTQQHLRTITGRLAHAVSLGDSRIWGVVREFYGTIDGERVFGWDLATNQAASSDDSHLWHLHISFYRRNVLRPALLAPVADVLAGKPSLPKR